MPETSPARKTSTCHKTVRSGTIYDFDMQERRRESLERAERLKAELGDEPITGTDDRIAYRFVKRVFDFAFSAAVLVLLSWLFVIIAILVKVDDPKGPVFFKQTRVGKNGREFEMLKFRSMCVDAEEKLADLKELNEKTGPVFKIAEDPRRQVTAQAESGRAAAVHQRAPLGHECRGPAPRAAERGCGLQRLPAPKAAGEARHDLLLANPPQPRLHHLRRVGRFGFMDWSRFLGRKNKLLQATSRSRSHGAL
nr:sugar transferase [Senegalimassilia anaerobia]